MMHEPLVDSIAAAKLAKKLFPDETDLAEAALLAITWLERVKVDGDGE